MSRPSAVAAHDPGSPNAPPSHRTAPVSQSRHRTACQAKYTCPPTTTGVHTLDGALARHTSVAPFRDTLTLTSALWLYAAVTRTQSPCTAGEAIVLAKSVTHGNVATVSPACPASSRTTARLRSVTTARHGTPS